MERIARVAIRVNGEVLAKDPPHRHFHIQNEVVPRSRAEGWTITDYEEGFTTDGGRFVGRKEAWGIAEAAGQILYPDASYAKSLLFSENLW